MVEKNDVEKQELSYEEEFTWVEREMMRYEQMDPDAEPLIDVFRRHHADDRLLAPFKAHLQTLVQQELPPILEKASEDLIGVRAKCGWFQVEIHFKPKEEREKEARIAQVLDSIT